MAGRLHVGVTQLVVALSHLTLVPALLSWELLLLGPLGAGKDDLVLPPSTFCVCGERLRLRVKLQLLFTAISTLARARVRERINNREDDDQEEDRADERPDERKCVPFP